MMDEFEREGPDFYEALGRTIQVLRTDQSLDRKDLADRAGISYSYLAAIENGKKPPSSKVLFAIAGALGLHSHELLASVEGRVQRRRALGRQGPQLPAPSRRQPWFHGAGVSPADRAEGPTAPTSAPAWAPAAGREPVPYSPAGFLLEIDRLTRVLSEEDRDMVLGLARHLAGREV